MKIENLGIDGIFVCEPDIYSDERGFFFESFNRKTFSEILGAELAFFQDNHSYSHKNVLRGLHFQKKHPQGKLVRVVSGEIFDVAVDLRKNSKTYGQWVAQVLSAQNRKQLWVPEGFAHGFLVLSEVADVLYKVTRPWVKDDEESIIWNDEDIGISWPIQDTSALIISAKDLRGKKLSEL